MALLHSRNPSASARRLKEKKKQILNSAFMILFTSSSLFMAPLLALLCCISIEMQLSLTKVNEAAGYLASCYLCSLLGLAENDIKEPLYASFYE